MNEIIFVAEGEYTAYALGQAIVTEADTLKELHEMIRDAVKCHFNKSEVPIFE